MCTVLKFIEDRCIVTFQHHVASCYHGNVSFVNSFASKHLDESKKRRSKIDLLWPSNPVSRRNRALTSSIHRLLQLTHNTGAWEALIVRIFGCIAKPKCKAMMLCEGLGGVKLRSLLAQFASMACSWLKDDHIRV